MLLYFLFFTNPQLITSFSYHCVFSNLLGFVEVVDEVLDNGRGVGGLDGLAVVGDDGARGGTGNNDTLLTLYHRPKRLAQIPMLRIDIIPEVFMGRGKRVCLPSCRIDCARQRGW